MKKIAVIGTGYVGLANALLLAQHNQVFAYDIDEQKIGENVSISVKPHCLTVFSLDVFNN